MSRNEEAIQFLDSCVGRKYALGQPDQGLDCLNYILFFYDHLGYRFPSSFEGITRENYAEHWRKNPKKTQEIMGRFLMSLGVPVDRHFIRKNDLLLFKGEEIPVFARIYYGNGNMGGVWKEGYLPVPLRHFERYLIAARRLI